MSSAYNSTHQFRTQLTGVAGGTHGTLTAKTMVGGVFDAADTTIPAVTAGAAVTAVVTYKDTGNAATDTLISYQEITPTTPDGSDFTVQWPTTGVFRFLAPGTNASVSVPMLTPARVIGTPIVTALPVSGGLSVVITRDSDGATAVYTEAAATVLDDYVDPGGQFTMGCKISAANATFPQFHVWFRSDKVGTARNEVVFEYGYCFSAFLPYMRAYHASIRLNGVEIANIAAPYHFHQSRWRWQSSVRPANRMTRQQLIDGKYVPPYSLAPTKGLTPATPIGSYSAPMDLAGIVGAMAAPGDHQEIGMVTNQTAEWIINGSTAALNTLMAQGEASASIPWHHRDETTAQRKPLDPYVYTHASMAAVNAPSPYLQMDPALNDDLNSDPGFLLACKPDVAHHPSLAYVPWLLTGDPFYLEEVQFLATYTIVVQPNGSRSFCNYFAIRAMGWSARSAGHALKAMPDAPMPGWLLPKSWFQTYLNDFITYLNANFLNNNVAPYNLFHTVERQFGDGLEQWTEPLPQGTFGQSYMEEYCSCAFSYVAYMGNPSWTPMANWKRDHSTQRCNPSSGWEVSITDPYRQRYRDTGWPSQGGWYTSWGQSWTRTQQTLNIAVTTPGVVDNSNGINVDYNTYTRCSLVWGKYLGDTAADAAYTFMNNSLMAPSGIKQGMPCQWKWSIDVPPP